MGNDFDWTIDIKPLIKWEKNKLYYFEPKLESFEVARLYNQLNLNDEFIINFMNEKIDKSISFIIIDNDFKINFWDGVTTFKWPVNNFYPGYEQINGREFLKDYLREFNSTL